MPGRAADFGSEFGRERTNSMSRGDGSRNSSPQVLQQLRGFFRRLFSAHQFAQDMFLHTLCLGLPSMFAGFRVRALPFLLAQVKDQFYPARGQRLARNAFAVLLQPLADEVERLLAITVRPTRYSHSEPPSSQTGFRVAAGGSSCSKTVRRMKDKKPQQHAFQKM